MRTKIIEKAPQKMLIEALKGERTFEEVDRLDSIAEKEWLILYQSIKNAECDCVYWEDAPATSQSGSISHLQHILTRSAKQVGAVQLTCILVRDGENIPLSDIQITDPAELLQHIPHRAEVNIL